MEISKVKNDIKTGKFDSLYIFAVEERYVARTYIDMIAEKSGARLEYVNSVAEIYSKLKVKSLIPMKTVYVIIDDKEFANSKYEARWDNVSREIKDDILILYYTNVDKRIKFWKHFQDRSVFFEPLDDRLLIRHITKRIDLSDKNCERLIEICDHDLGRILLEVDKIRRYAEWNVTLVRNIYNNAFDIMLKDGTLYQPPKDAIFDFVGAVLAQDIDKAYYLYEDCKSIGEPNMRIVSVLYNNFKTLLQVQSVYDNVAKSTGLTGWQIKLVKPFVDNYSDEDIVSILHMLSRVEKGIKTGGIQEISSVEYALINIFNKVRRS